MRRTIPVVLIAFVCLSLCIHAFSVSSPTSLSFWTMLTTAAASGALIYWLRPRALDEATVAEKTDLKTRTEQLQSQITTFEETRAALLTELDHRSGRLGEREHLLAARFARFQEFLEYPVEDLHESRSTAELQQLSENDRRVRKLLETEAERVYEKIRRNGYTVNGKVDVFAIRDEAHLLFRQVAQIYKPGSENPLLETSFEQLARAASRVCLHLLVLLEQLPVNVQHYNISTLYGYFQKAVTGYGVYQKATPWLSYLSRGLYAGRIAAASNPATIGAWWLATEVGKMGASKLIENVVDRQAVAVLHQVIAVIGVEAASIYGAGFRHRDPAWILGTELVELIHSFPPSGESLRNGMKTITGLPLRNEYDRIYLYRCLANHRSAGLHVADSAMLTREEREKIALQLEQFFEDHIHGANDTTTQKWREAAEQRLDLRFNLQHTTNRPKASVRQCAESAVMSLSAFLQNFIQHSSASSAETLKATRSFQLLDVPQQEAALRRLSSDSNLLPFEPPELDPSSEVTNTFLSDLTMCAVSADRPDEQIEQLVAEMYGYFRHTVAESSLALEKAWLQKLRWASVEDLPIDSLPAGASKAFFEHRVDHERMAFCHDGLSALHQDSLFPIPNSLIVGFVAPTSGSVQNRRAIVVSLDSREVLWNAKAPMKVDRRAGILLDSAEIHGGVWNDTLMRSKAISASAPVVIEGSLRGGRFKNYFRRLLEFGQ